MKQLFGQILQSSGGKKEVLCAALLFGLLGKLFFVNLRKLFDPVAALHALALELSSFEQITLAPLWGIATRAGRS